MTRTTGKRKAGSDQPESSQPPPTDATGPRKIKIPKMTAASLTMPEEKHPWLKWPGCSNERKIELNNRLADLQSRTICQPRFLDSEAVDKLSLKHQLDKLFLTRVENEDGELSIPIWRKAVSVTGGEEIYREWCLEFYCSLRVEKKFRGHEFYSKKLIHFRLGGKEHSKTLAEFGYLTGLLTEAESKHDLISTYLMTGKRSSKEFVPEANEAWAELTGLEKHNSTSKVSAIRKPILRLVHKLLVYSFTHRLTQHDKCYLDDLWLVYTIGKREPGNFVCAPWVLANFMEQKGAGKKKDSQICCGHFVTKIARNLKLCTTANINACSRPVEFKRITLHDLEVLRLLNPSQTGLAEETEVDIPEAPVRERKKRETIMSALEGIQKQNREMKRLNEATQRMVNCLSKRLEYHLDRYRPILEQLAVENATASGKSLDTYAPPAPFAPISDDEDTEEQEVQEEGSESGEASSEEAPEDEEAEEED